MRSPGKRPDKNHLPQNYYNVRRRVGFAGAYVLISIKVKKQHKGFIILMLSSSYMYDPFLADSRLAPSDFSELEHCSLSQILVLTGE